MVKKILLLVRSFNFLVLGISFFLFISKASGQSAVTRIHTDWTAGGYWTSNGATGVGNRPDTENNLLGFLWDGTTYSTGVDDIILTSKGVVYSAQKFRALKIQSLSYTSGTYFLQGSMIDGSLTGRVLTPPLAGSTSTPAELASRLTDGKNGLALGTGIANIATNSVFFKVGTSNLNVLGLNDGIPDLIVTQVAQPGGADVFKFVDASGTIVGNAINIDFSSVPIVGSYSLDLFNASNGAIATSFIAQETRDIRIIGYDTSAFGINAGNAAQVDRFVVTFSGSSDCAFIAFNANSLKKAELSLVKKATVTGCGAAGDLINYTFEVTNTGDVPVTNVTVTDPLTGLVITGTQGSTLAVNGTVTLTGTYTITAADVTAGSVTNSAKVSGIDPSLNTVEDISGQTNNDDIATVTILSPGPTGIAAQSFCSISSPTVANLSATGTAIKWYANASGGSALLTTAALVNGTHYYASQTIGGCESRSRLNVTATVNNPSAPTGTASQTFCSAAFPTVADLTATGTGIHWYAHASGGSALSVTTALVNGTHYYATQTVSGCESTTRFDVTATVRITPSVPVPGHITQPDCMLSTGSVVLSGLIVSEILNQTGTAANSYPITSTTMTISGLAAGTYNFSASNGTCPSSLSGNVVINPSITKIWSAGVWSPSAPTSSDAAVVNGNYSISSNGDLNVCSLTINSGTLTVEPGKILIVQNNLTVNGTLDLLDKGSLVMINNLGTVGGTGTANVRRITTPFKRNDYVYWSTPVSTAAISSASSGTFPGWRTGFAYEYNNSWVTASVMTPAKGYIVMVPDPTAGPGGNISEAIFKGKVNNGIYKVSSIAANKSYLLGNPYPSAIDADQFILQNSGVIGGTLYFWTHNTAIQLASNINNGTAGSGAYAFTSDDYASYNITGGTATGTAAVTGGGAPLGKIASAQGFFTTSKASITGAAEFVFNNSMRVATGINSNAQFYKTKASPNTEKTASSIEKHRVWLNLSNDQGAFKQTLLGYIEGATNGDDALFDGKTLDGNKFIDFYSVIPNKNLVIQGRALPFDEKDEVPLGFKTAVDGTFAINIEQTDGLLTNQAIFLEDKLTNTVFNLKTGSYTFSTDKGTFDDRFVLKYSDKTLGTKDFDAKANKVLVAVKNKQIKINSFSEIIKKVIVYDISGKQIYQKDNVNTNELSIINLIVANQVLIVKTTLQNGMITTDKIVY